MRIVHQLQAVLAADAASTNLSIKVLDANETQVVLGLTVTKSMTNGYKICHGGVIFSLADTALAFACMAAGVTAVTQSAQIEYIQAGQLGDHLTATSKIIHRHKRHLLCDVEVLNQQAEIVAIVHSRQRVIQTER